MFCTIFLDHRSPICECGADTPTGGQGDRDGLHETQLRQQTNDPDQRARLRHEPAASAHGRQAVFGTGDRLLPEAVGG